VCVGSLDDASLAAELGADRLEFCSSLELGGLTPSFDEVNRLRNTVAIPIAVMVRPRGGDFCYSDAEWRSMVRDAGCALAAGADAVVFGALTADRTIELERVREIVAVVQKWEGRHAVFHRAFDDVVDPRKAWAALCDAGVDRVLTSGGAATAVEGISRLQAFIALSAMNGDRPTVLAGGGVRASNVAPLIRETGATEIHSACSAASRQFRLDPEQLKLLVAAIRAFEGVERQNAVPREPEK